MIRQGGFAIIAACLLGNVAALLAQQAGPGAGSPERQLQILNGQPTLVYFTGNPHHPTFGQEKLSALLNRYFEGQSPVRLQGLADARKDPVTGEPIPQAPISQLGRFLEPVLKARRPQGERLVVLTYVLVESPRNKRERDWVKESADALAEYGRQALAQGASVVFVSEMVLPDFTGGAKPVNRFRRDGLQVFDALEGRNIAGLQRGPQFQQLMESRRHLFRDERHFSDLGKDLMGCLWMTALLQHDGLAIPDWLRSETDELLKER